MVSLPSLVCIKPATQTRDIVASLIDLRAFLFLFSQYQVRVRPRVTFLSARVVIEPITQLSDSIILCAILVNRANLDTLLLKLLLFERRILRRVTLLPVRFCFEPVAQISKFTLEFFVFFEIFAFAPQQLFPLTLLFMLLLLFLPRNLGAALLFLLLQRRILDRVLLKPTLVHIEPLTQAVEVIAERGNLAPFLLQALLFPPLQRCVFG